MTASGTQAGAECLRPLPFSARSPMPSGRADRPAHLLTQPQQRHARGRHYTPPGKKTGARVDSAQKCRDSGGPLGERESARCVHVVDHRAGQCCSAASAAAKLSPTSARFATGRIKSGRRARGLSSIAVGSFRVPPLPVKTQSRIKRTPASEASPRRHTFSHDLRKRGCRSFLLPTSFLKPLSPS